MSISSILTIYVACPLILSSIDVSTKSGYFHKFNGLGLLELVILVLMSAYSLDNIPCDIEQRDTDGHYGDSYDGAAGLFVMAFCIAIVLYDFFYETLLYFQKLLS